MNPGGAMNRPAFSRTTRRAALRSMGAAALVLGVRDLAFGAGVVAVRVWPAADYTRVTIESDAPLAQRHFLADQPNRLVIDIDGLELTPALRELVGKIRPDDPYIAGVRAGQNQPRVVRVVIDLKQATAPQLFTLAPVAAYQYRLVFDLYPVEAPDPLLALIRDRAGAEQSAAKELQDALGEFIGRVDRPGPGGAASGVGALPGDRMATAAGSAVPSRGAASDALPGHAGSTVTPGAAPSAWPPGAAESPTWTARPVPAQPPPVAQTLPPAVTPALPPVALSNTPPPRDGLPRGRPGAPPTLPPAIQNRIDRLIVVAIDPGHGGEDPGATGATGLREKDVVLRIALQLRDRVNTLPNMRAFLTRDSDFFVPLHERVKKAQRVQADLFVSIHADAFISPDARGASVFALSQGGASSAAARWMANRENAADAVGGVNASARDPTVLRALLDMSTTAQIRDSKQLGDAVLGEIGRVGKLHKGSVEQAGFAVLKAPDIPSILVESAFISNPEEEGKLRDPEYQARLVQALAVGIQRYFAKNPPLARSRQL